MAQTGTPRTKFFVPSIGSTTHCREPWPVGSNSSPTTASRGRVRRSWLRIELLGGPVGVADRGQVGLGLDPQVGREEARHRQRVDHVGDDVRQAKVVVVGRHAGSSLASGRPGPAGWRSAADGTATGAHREAAGRTVTPPGGSPGAGPAAVPQPHATRVDRALTFVAGVLDPPVPSVQIMFDVIAGLPVHPLVVHAVVVLLPIMAVVTVLVAARTPWRGALRWVVVADALVLVSAVVADQSGEALQGRLSQAGEKVAEDHGELGGTIPSWPSSCSSPPSSPGSRPARAASSCR